MKKKSILRSMAASMAVAGMMFASIPALAAESPESPELPELPKSITIDGKEYVMDETAGGGSDTATHDNSMSKVQTFASYKLLGSDVGLYINQNNHGGDHYAYGWVRTTAPTFTARAEIWSNGKVNTTGPNKLNSGDIAYAFSNQAIGLVPNATPRIFYAW